MSYNTYLTREEWEDKNEQIKELLETKNSVVNAKRQIELINSISTNSEEKRKFMYNTLNSLYPGAGYFIDNSKKMLLLETAFNYFEEIKKMNNTDDITNSDMTNTSYKDYNASTKMNYDIKLNEIKQLYSNIVNFGKYIKVQLIVKKNIKDIDTDILGIETINNNIEILQRKKWKDYPFGIDVSITMQNKIIDDNNVIINDDSITDVGVKKEATKKMQEALTEKTKIEKYLTDNQVSYDNYNIQINDLQTNIRKNIDNMITTIDKELERKGVSKDDTKTTRTNRKDMLDKVKQPIIDLLWQWENRRIPDATQATPQNDKYRFKIESNGDITVYEAVNSANKHQMSIKMKLNAVAECGGDAKCVTLAKLNSNMITEDEKKGIGADFFKSFTEHRKIAESFAVLKNLGWVLIEDNGKDRVTTLNDLRKLGVVNGSHIYTTLLAIGIEEKSIDNKTLTSKVGYENFVAFIEDCIATVNKNSGILDLKFIQTVGNTTSRRRISRTRAIESHQEQLRSPLRNLMTLSRPLYGGVILTGRESYNIVGEHVGGHNNDQHGGSLNCADSYSNRLNGFLRLLKARDKTLTSDSLRALNNKITLIKNLENELNALMDNMNKYIQSSNERSRESLSLDDIAKISKVSRQLTKSTITLYNGFLKLTGHIDLPNASAPATGKDYRKL